MKKSSQIAFICVCLICATVIAFSPAFHADFLDYDDDYYVKKNPYVGAGLTLKSVVWAFTAVHASNWHPLTWISHMIDVELFGLNPKGHHAINVLFHAANAVLLFFCLRLVTGAVWRSAFVAALFALHPMHVESVAWVSERKDVLSTFFGLLAFWAYGAYAKNLPTTTASIEGKHPNKPIRHPKKYFWIALVCFALSLLSKPMLVTLPFLFLLLDFWPLERIKTEANQMPANAVNGDREQPELKRWVHALLRLVREKIPFFALAFGVCAITLLAQEKGGSVVPISDLPMGKRIINAIVSYEWYVARFAWPTKLAVIYPLFPTYPLARIIEAAVIIGFLTIFAIKLARRQSYIFVGWFWFLGQLVPVIGLVQVGMQAYADRYTYMPYVGLSIAVTWAVEELTRKLRYRRILLPIGAAGILVACGIATFNQTRLWKNNETLFSHAVKVTQYNYIAVNNLGYALAEKGELDKAIEHFQAALKIAPKYDVALNNLGCAYVKLGKSAEALDYFRQALEIKPNNTQLRLNYGTALHETGQYRQAITEFEEVIRKEPNLPEVYYCLANSLEAVGRRDEAVQNYIRAIQLKPSFADAHHNLGLILLADGKPEDALKHFREASRLKPAWAAPYVGMGAAYHTLNLAQEAIASYRTAIQLDSKNPNTFYQLGMILAAQTNFVEAQSAFSKAIELNPTNAQFYLALAFALDQEGKKTEAIPHYEKVLELNANLPAALNNLAWILATHPDASVRDGERAVKLAEQSCELTEGKEALFLGTLAAAYAEAGRFDEAIRTAEKARALAEAAGATNLVTKNAELLILYKAGKPYRENP